MLRRTFVAVGVAAGLLLGAGSAAWAQKPERVTIKGKLSGLSAGQLLVTDTDGKATLVVPSQKKLQFAVKGTATPEFLQRGVVVQFEAMIDKTGVVQGELKQLTITELSDKNPPMLADQGDPGQAERGETVKYFVRAQVQANKDGELTIGAPGKVLKVKLAPNCKIDLSVTDFTLCRAGDGVEVVGDKPANGPVVADYLVITLAEPLTGKKRPATK